MYDTIIIGGGPAGVTAAIYAARKKLKTLLISENIGGQILETWEIENYPGQREITGASLAQKFEDHLKKFNVTIRKEKIIEIKKIASLQFLLKSEQSEYRAKTLILAMGKRPRELDVPGEKKFKNKGVSYCATCDGPLFQNKTVAVVGGGNAGLEAVIQMNKIVQKIYLIESDRACSGDPLLLDKIKSSAKIFTNSEIVKVYGDNLVGGVKVKNNKTNDIQDLKLEGIFVEIGSIPNSEIVKSLIELNQEGKIKIDKFCQTSEKGIFACGDITDVPYEQIVIAAGEGAKAAISAFNYLAKRNQNLKIKV